MYYKNDQIWPMVFGLSFAVKYYKSPLKLCKFVNKIKKIQLVDSISLKTVFKAKFSCIFKKNQLGRGPKIPHVNVIPENFLEHYKVAKLKVLKPFALKF